MTDPDAHAPIIGAERRGDEAGVVTVACVLGTGIAEPGDEKRRVGHGRAEARARAYFFSGALAGAAAPGAAPGAPAASAAAPSAGTAATSSSVGGAAAA